jgi:hypothetical protein
MRNKSSRVGNKVSCHATGVGNGWPHELIRWNGVGFSGTIVFHNLVDGDGFVVRIGSSSERSGRERRTIHLVGASLKTPPRGSVATIGLASLGIFARRELQDFDLKDISWFGSIYKDRSADKMNDRSKKAGYG